MPVLRKRTLSIPILLVCALTQMPPAHAQLAQIVIVVVSQATRTIAATLKGHKGEQASMAASVRQQVINENGQGEDPTNNSSSSQGPMTATKSVRGRLTAGKAQAAKSTTETQVNDSNNPDRESQDQDTSTQAPSAPTIMMPMPK